jgi:hypothetical protein
MIQQFTFKDLAEFDGGVIAAAVNAAIKRAVADCDDRPALKAGREVTLKLKFTPLIDADGVAEEARFEFAMGEKLPGRSSKAYSMGLRKGGVLTFNPKALDNHNQETFPFDNDNN